jgi:hypothetical protein
MSFADWSTTASANGSVLGVNIAENCPPSNVNDAIRAALAQIRAAINPALDDFLSSTSLSSARSALGVASPDSSSSLTAFGNLTNAANKVPYMTGSDTWSTADFTSFGRSVVACGNAAALNTLLGAEGASGTFGTNSIDVRMAIGTNTLCIKGGSGTLAANTTGTLSFGVTFAVAPVCIVTGGDSDVQSEGQIRISANPTTTGVAIINAGPASGTYNWVALGRV